MPNSNPITAGNNTDGSSAVTEEEACASSEACLTAESPFDRVWETVRELEHLVEAGLADGPVESSPIIGRLHELTGAFTEAEKTHRDAIAHADALSHAQADALVKSAEIIEELERTKTQLSEARRIAERQREERLRLLGGVFENAQEGVVILDGDACVQEVNPVFLEIAQRSAGEVLGRHLAAVFDWVFPDYDTALRTVMSGQAWTGRVVITRSGGGERSYLLSFSPVQNDGQPSNAIVMFSDVTDIDTTQRRLKQQALHDQLTGLPNRRFCRERIQSLIDVSECDKSAFAVCFLDLDDFKHVNDSLGHNAGDELLIEVARRLRKHAGDDAFVARFGGDEFAILIPNTNADLRKTATVTDRVLQALREPILVADKDAHIGASIGVTEFPTHSDSIDELLQNADVAMYAAKNAGRNRICMFSPEMRSQVEQRHRIQNELQRALNGCEISLHYQPQVDLTTGGLVGCEALARWRTPDGRNISPGEFIPVAEQSGLVIPLGELVLMTACEQIAKWESMGCRPPHVAVNISPQHLHARHFVNRIAEILSETGVRPEWIELEITENAVMNDVQHAMRTMDALVELGLTLAIDDFGTGHSSLSYLRQFNIHTLKVDRSFVMDLPSDERSHSIVRSIIHLGQGRDLTIVAEGIETQAQFDLLCEMGCDIGQGYHIAYPLQSVDFENWCIEEWKMGNGERRT